MVKCSNCHCDIDESKMFLHERFCFQNIKYCEICKEGIIKEEFEEHCENHKKNSNELKKLDSEEDRNSRSLKRVESSKVACQYCGLFLIYAEIEEHEQMCGARTTQCKICQKNVIYKDLENHLNNFHNMNKNTYKEYDSGLYVNNNFDYNENVNQPKKNINTNLTQEQLRRMTSEEQIQYALAMSQDQNNSGNKGNYTSKDFKSKDNLPKKSSSGIDYDEIDNEYQRQMYEDEMRNFE